MVNLNKKLLALHPYYPPTNHRNTDSVSQHIQMHGTNSIQNQHLKYISKKKHTTRSEWKEYSDYTVWLKKNCSQVEEHLDRRINLFFYQLMTCADTPYHYESHAAENQYGKGIKASISPPYYVKELSAKFFTQAAHSAIHPCLTICPIKEWEKYKKSKSHQFYPSIYLEYSHYYKMQNSTIELPLCVNQTDSYIDGTNKNPKLRADTLSIINNIAKNKLSIEKAHEKFLNVFKMHCKETIEKLDKNDPRRKVAKIYKKRVKKHLDQMHCPTENYFSDLLGEYKNLVKEKNIENYNNQKKLSQHIEAAIAKKISIAQTKIFHKKNTTLNNINNQFFYVLLEKSIKYPGLKTYLEHVYCITSKSLKKHLSIQKIKNIENFRSKHKAVISELTRDLYKLFKQL